MSHIIERASSGRAKCRGCEQRIANGDWRLGERRPNPYADAGSEVTHWFHIPCGALMRPEPFLEALQDLSGTPDVIDGLEWLEREARLGLEHSRLPRARNAERAASGRATCRACRDVIAKDTWRVALAYYEEGRFAPSGFVHARCAPAYFETTDLIDRLRRLSPDLTPQDVDALVRELAEATPLSSLNPERTSDADPT
jgi:ribosomal protein L37AE/L43A